MMMMTKKELMKRFPPTASRIIQKNNASDEKRWLAFNKLGAEEQKDFLTKALRAHNSGDGVPDGSAEKGRKSLRPGGGTTTAGDIKMKELKEELELLMAELFPEFTPELQQKMSELFFDWWVTDFVPRCLSCSIITRSFVGCLIVLVI